MHISHSVSLLSFLSVVTSVHSAAISTPNADRTVTVTVHDNSCSASNTNTASSQTSIPTGSSGNGDPGNSQSISGSGSVSVSGSISMSTIDRQSSDPNAPTGASEGDPNSTGSALTGSNIAFPTGFSGSNTVNPTELSGSNTAVPTDFSGTPTSFTGAPSSTETGAYGTITSTFPGLTTYSQTTTTFTSGTEHRTTILPIWPCITVPFPGCGIMVIPHDPFHVTGPIIPPPPCYPAITIGENGLPTPGLAGPAADCSETAKPGPSSDASSSNSASSATSSMSSACTACQACPTGTFEVEEPEGPELSQADENLWAVKKNAKLKPRNDESRFLEEYIESRDVESRNITEQSLVPRDTRQPTTCRGQVVYRPGEYPSWGKAEGNVNIIQFAGYREIQPSGPNSLCNWAYSPAPGPKINAKYATEHIFEIHFMESFFNQITWENRIDCSTDDMKGIFKTKSPTKGSLFSCETPNEKISQAYSEEEKAGELYLLEKEVNGMKTVVLSNLKTGTTDSLQEDNKLPDLDKGGWGNTLKQINLVRMVAEYMNDDKVFGVFQKVNQRMRDVLHAIDNDPFYTYHPTSPKEATIPGDVIDCDKWLTCYDNWMKQFIETKNFKMFNWMEDARPRLIKKINDAQLSNELTKSQAEAYVAEVNANSGPGGRFNPEVVLFRGDYYSLGANPPSKVKRGDDDGAACAIGFSVTSGEATSLAGPTGASNSVPLSATRGASDVSGTPSLSRGTDSISASPVTDRSEVSTAASASAGVSFTSAHQTTDASETSPATSTGISSEATTPKPTSEGFTTKKRVSPITMTFDKPAETPSCQADGSQTYVTTQGVSLPSNVPSLDILMPLAAQPGAWQIQVGGPSDPKENVINYQLKNTQVNGPPLDSGTGGKSSWSWTNTQTNIADEMQFLMKADQGIEIYQVTLSGHVGCQTPTPTPSPSPTPDLSSPTPPYKVIYPDGKKMSCPSNYDFTNLDSCFDNVFQNFSTSATYSTGTSNICYGQGTVSDQDVPVGDFCVLARSGSCALVWGMDFAWGSNRKVSFTGQELKDFLDDAKSSCGGQGPRAAIRNVARSPDTTPFGYDHSFCLMHTDSVGGCGTKQGFP